MGSERLSLLDVYLQLRPTLVRYFAAKAGSSAAAEDLVQEIYFRVQRLAPHEDVHDPKAWLFKTGLNLLLDERRRESRERQRAHAWTEGEQRIGGEALSPEPSAERSVADRQDLSRVIALIDAMPPRMAQAVRLHKLQGLTQAQTAERMGVSVKAVEKHLAEALQRLAGARDGVAS